MLRSASLRRTPVRVGVLDILAASAQPLGVTQLLAQLPSRTDAVTVYRTLNAFTRKRLVHRVRGEDRTWRYALGAQASRRNDRAHPHPHFICEACGQVECLEGAKLPKNLLRALHVDSGYDVHYPELLLHGVCPRCR